MEKKPHFRQLILSLMVWSMSFFGCDNPFDEGTSSQPDFEAGATGFNDITDVFIEINASRDSGDVSGDGVVVIGDEQFTLNVVDATLSTDFGMEDPIPQTDNLLVGVDFVCTPAFAELTVVLSPGESVTTIVLNEFNGHCAPDDPCVVPIDVGIFVPELQ